MIYTNVNQIFMPAIEVSFKVFESQ